MGKIVKADVRSVNPVRGERSDKNQYPNGGTDGSRAPRGTHQINPAKVPTTAKKK